MIAFEKCFTGRKWINIGFGWFAIGFGRCMVVALAALRFGGVI